MNLGHNFSKIIRHPLLFYTSIYAVLLIIYSPILLRSLPILNDYDVVITPLSKVSSISEYLKLMFSLKTVDIQPIRDFSHLLDLYLLKHGIFFFHAHNLLCWFLIIFVVSKIFSLISNSRPLAMLVTLLFAFHPALLQSVNLVVGRKHLLAFLFITMATYLLLKAQVQVQQQNSVIAKKWPSTLPAFPTFLLLLTLLYTLSIFSQPITLLWSCWCILFIFLFFHNDSDNKHEHGNKTLYSYTPLLLMLLLMLFNIAANAYYYEHYYAVQFASSKYDGSEEYIYIKLLALGRMFFQLIYPHDFTFLYSSDSLKNWIGLGLLIPFLYILKKRLPLKSLLLWISFSLIPIPILLYRMTQIFYQDAYLLVPSLGFFILLLLLLHSFLPAQKERQRSWAIALFACSIPLFISFCYRTFSELKLLTDGTAYLKNSYEKEPSCRTLFAYAYHTLYAHSVSEGLPLAKKFFSKNCSFYTSAIDNATSEKMLAITIYSDQEIDIESKINSLKKIKDNNIAITVLYHSLILGRNLTKSRHSDSRPKENPLKEITELIKEKWPMSPPTNELIFNLAQKEITQFCKQTNPASKDATKSCLHYEEALCKRFAICKSKQAQ
ncbi:MAG: hypothetical protein HQK52_12145 [Oligoflexia bacterium]|nr:hypothetical protein [Oligoflexia bacterium]